MPAAEKRAPAGKTDYDEESVLGGAPRGPGIRRLVFSADGFRLTGWLHHPGLEGVPVVIGSHGLASDAHSPKQRALARACTARRMAYLRFDHRGCGPDKENRAVVTTLAGRVADLLAAAEAAGQVPGIAGPVALFGSSLGAAVCMAAAEALEPAALVLFAAPVRSRTIAGADGGTRGAGLDFDLGDVLPRLHHALVVHGTADAVVPVADAREIFTAAKDPKRLLLQSGGDHRMSDRTHQTRFVAAAVAWFAARWY